MSSRNNMFPTEVFPEGNNDMSLDLKSSISITPFISLVSYDISWVGTSPVGTISVETSNSYTQNPDGSTKDAGNWTVLPFTNSAGTLVTSQAISGNTGNGFIAINVNPGYAIRLSYGTTSGTGVISAKVLGKVY